jgi:hypothetical protein
MYQVALCKWQSDVLGVRACSGKFTEVTRVCTLTQLNTLQVGLQGRSRHKTSATCTAIPSLTMPRHVVANTVQPLSKQQMHASVSVNRSNPFCDKKPIRAHSGCHKSTTEHTIMQQSPGVHSHVAYAPGAHVAFSIPPAPTRKWEKGCCPGLSDILPAAAAAFRHAET